MSKKLLGCIAFLFSLFQLSAQTDFRFADSTAQWNVLQTQHGWCYCGSMYTHVHKVTGDTLINATNYQKISWHNGSEYYLRRDSAKVYLHYAQSNTDSLLYDFGASKGDTIKFRALTGFNLDNPIISCYVDSVDTILLDKPRRREFVKCTGYYISPDIARADVWIDGIGALNSDLLTPGFDASAVDGPEESLLCFFEKDSVVYHDTRYESCVIDTSWMGIKDAIAETLISVSPNPVSDNHINIQLDDNPNESLSFQLYDIPGRMILQKSLTGTMNSVTLNQVSRGMYLYNIISSDRKITSGKLVVQ